MLFFKSAEVYFLLFADIFWWWTLWTESVIILYSWFFFFPSSIRHNLKKLTYEERKAKLIERLNALNSAADEDEDEDEDDEWTPQ